MTNQLAIVLGVLLFGTIAYDGIANGGENIVFILKKFLELIEWTAFWR